METVVSIVAACRDGAVRPEDNVARSYARIRAHGDPAVFVSLRDERDAIAEARALAVQDARSLPLYGVPVAIKDNIDVEGLETTAACPSFAYRASRDAVCVARLRRAGAIVIGKTNLDQFATGLVGVRSPYGVPRNPLNASLVPGGSSSGSAVAVAAGLVPLALGTDTAGSGRIPAGLNNIVGIKPSLGLVPTTGVVPACRSLDSVSVFALTADDAFTALQTMAGPDANDPFARNVGLQALDLPVSGMRIGVPRPEQRQYFGDARAEASFMSALGILSKIGMDIVDVDFSAMLETAQLLYEGPWVAERTCAVGEFIEKHPDAILPVTRDIILAGRKLSAVDAFRGNYRLAALRTAASRVLATVDALMVPTAPAAYTVEQVDADPLRLNSRLGTYTNFVNLLDLCGTAVPAAIADDGTPYGVTFLAPAGRDALTASIGRSFHHQTKLPLGAITAAHPPLPVRQEQPGGDIAIAVVGAHLSGMPLNGELQILGARLVERTITSADYKLFALPGAARRPGLLRIADGTGSAIETEIWTLSFEAFGRFIATIPAPLSIGTVRLADGRSVKGFLVEAVATADACDISRFGGWRAFVSSAEVDHAAS